MRYVAILSMMVLASPAGAAVINLSASVTSTAVAPIVTGLNGFAVPLLTGRISTTSTATAAIDDVTNTARFVSASFIHTAPARTITRSRTLLVTDPGNFPDPPMEVFKTFTETISFDALNISTPVQFLSGTTAVLTPVAGPVFAFFSPITFAPPTSLIVSGTYTLQGPTESIVAPFSVQFHTAATQTKYVRGIVNVGANYPATAQLTLGQGFGVNYSVATPGADDIFKGTVDGLEIEVHLGAPKVPVFVVPEPPTVALIALVVLPLVRRPRHKGAEGLRATLGPVSRSGSS